MNTIQQKNGGCIRCTTAGERTRNGGKLGLQLVLSCRGRNKKQQRTGASVSTQLQGKEQETAENWGFS
jgi:hypothetical protein